MAGRDGLGALGEEGGVTRVLWFFLGVWGCDFSQTRRNLVVDRVAGFWII